MLLFRDGHLDEYLTRREQLLHDHVRSQDEDYLLNVNVEEFEQYLVDRYQLEPLALDRDGATASEEERLIPAEQFPPHFNVYAGKSYPRQVLTFHVPYSGESDLLRFRPSHFSHLFPEAHPTDQELELSMINWRDDADALRAEYETSVRLIESWFDNSRADVLGFNARLPEIARSSLGARRENILKRRSITESIGVPIRRIENSSGTFAVPKAATRIVVARPKAATARYVPEPTLEASDYTEILKVMNDGGEQIETHPSLHEGKEEGLRDALLMALAPNFDSASGETFHKGGKTDILIRHESKNLFVAECLVWNGQAYYLGKIDQALRYLTWRDSKAAMVVFSRNQNFQPVLDAIREATPNHPCFVSDRGRRSEGWFEYGFHLPNDDSRGVSLATLCFNVH